MEAEIKRILLEDYERFYRLAYSYVRNEADALDVVQESAYKAMKGAGTLRETAYARTWVYRIVINESLQLLRQKAKTVSLEAPASLAGEEHSGGKVPEPVRMAYGVLSGTAGAGFASAPEAQAEQLDLKKALQQLSGEQQTLIRLRFFEELKLEEIADVLDENVSTVKSRLYRTLRQLKAAL